MTIYLFIILLIILFTFCLIKNIPAYTYFTKGAQESIEICVNTFPFLVAIFIFVELFRVSGLSNMFATALEPILNFFGIPKELAELMIIKPFSGSGSTAILSECIKTYGADSYIARCASVMMNTSETLFYITAVYFGSVKQKKLLYAIPVSLIASFVGAIISCLLCKVM